MNSFIFDDGIIFDTCEHITEYKDKILGPVRIYPDPYPIGFDKNGNQHLLCLCIACGERLERQMFINMLTNLKLNVHINRGKIILDNKNIWKRFIEILKVD